MKNKYSDEKLDVMLTRMFNKEIPEDMQFHEQISDDINVTVKKSGFQGRRKLIRICVSFTLAAFIAFPVYFMQSGERKSNQESGLSVTISDEGFQNQLNLFREEQGKYSFVCVPLQSSRYYREFLKKPYAENNNSTATGILLSLGLIPYDLTETENKELYIRVLESETGTVYTRQAYITGCDETGSINYILKSDETISEDEARIFEYADVFKGADNAESGFQRIISKFQNRDIKVKIDGIVVRDEIRDDTEFELNTENLYACVRTNGILVPLSICELYCSISEKLPEKKEIPEYIKVHYSRNETSYFTVLMYDCTKSNSVRTELTESESIWNTD